MDPRNVKATSYHIGFQEGAGEIPGFHLYNLLVAIPGHCAGSTVTEKTLRAAGLTVPEPFICREIAILLQKPAADEAAFKLQNILDSEDMLEETLKDGVTKLELEVASRELTRGGGQFCYTARLWTCIAAELLNSDMDETALRISAKLVEVPGTRENKAAVPRRHPGNVTTKDFKNTSRYPDALVRSFIKFIMPRTPKGMKVIIEQGDRLCSGRGWAASKCSSFHGGSCWNSGGKIYIKAPATGHDRKKIIYPAHRGYLEQVFYGADEAFFAVIAHEIRHVQQGYARSFRECRKIRRHQLGTNGKLSEVDACLFEIRALRRFRREFPRPSPSVLPLP